MIIQWRHFLTIHLFRQILFLADVRVDWDKYKNCCILTAMGKTIISFSPATPEAKVLASYAETVDLSPNGRLELMIKNVDYKSIQVFTILKDSRHLCREVVKAKLYFE